MIADTQELNVCVTCFGFTSQSIRCASPLAMAWQTVYSRNMQDGDQIFLIEADQNRYSVFTPNWAPAIAIRANNGDLAMGMYVSQLRCVPVGRYNYYVYLVDSSAQASHSNQVDRFFTAFAKQSEVDAVIVRGPQDLSAELFCFLHEHAPTDFERLEHLFHEATCIIISEGALQTTSQPLHLLPLLARGEELHNSQSLDAFLESLLQAMLSRQLAAFVQSLGAERIALSEIKEGMFIATLRRINEALELKPNIVGFGLNLNAIIERFVGPSQRRLRE